MKSTLLNVEDARRGARKRLPRGLFEYIDRGAEDEYLLSAHRRALDEIRLVPKVLNNVSERSQAVEILGKKRPSPLIVAPTACAGLVHFNGEIELAKAAKTVGIPFTVATQSMTSVERIADEAGGELWFQLYVWKNRKRTLTLLDRAKAAGCETILLTVDTAVYPKREYNIRNGFGIPLEMSIQAAVDVMIHPRWLMSVFLRGILAGGVPTYAHYPDEFRTHIGRVSLAGETTLASDLSWDDVKMLRKYWHGNLLLKGVLDVDDAIRAADLRLDGVVVSNHGARNFDSGPPSTKVLQHIAERVGGRLTVLADSGVRRGSDIAKFLALGAKGVLTGRSALYGLAIDGGAGAETILRLLCDELSTTMGFLGVTATDDLPARLFDSRGACN